MMNIINVDEPNAPLIVEVPLRRDYAFTLRKTNVKHGVEHSHYLEHISKMEKYGVVFRDTNYETTNGLHCHGIVSISESMSLKRLRFRGWHLHLIELYDEDGWIRYIRKDVDV